MQILNTLVLLCAIVLVKGGYVSYEDCGSLYKIQNLDIDGCYELPCELKKGTYQNVTLSLLSRFTSQKFEHSASILYPVIFPLAILPYEPCETIKCPFVENQSKNFTVTLNITTNLITRPGELFMTMHNEKNRQVLCMKTSILVN